jgi:hypothetical protein
MIAVVIVAHGADGVKETFKLGNLTPAENIVSD